MKFLCLVYEVEEELNALPHDEWSELRRDVLAYVEALRSSGKLIASNALKSARTAATIRVRGDHLSVTDGPFAEAKEHIGGFFLIEAANREEALRIAADWPSARLGSIEVRPIEEALRAERRYA